MKLFVTGGTGFIGSHFLRAAIDADFQVSALRRTPGKNTKTHLPIEPRWVDKQMTEVTTHDLRGHDVVVHLAAHSANVPYDTLERCIYWNVVTPLNLFYTAIEAGITRFVVAGTCFEYGSAGERYEFIPPNAPLEAVASYPASKAMASVAFNAFARERSSKLSLHRIFHVYGNGEDENRFWPSLRRAAIAGDDFQMTSGDQVRDFIPVENAALQLLMACQDNTVSPGIAKVKNLGTGSPQTIREFAEYWWKKWDAKGELIIGAIPYRSGESMRFVPEL